MILDLFANEIYKNDRFYLKQILFCYQQLKAVNNR